VLQALAQKEVLVYVSPFPGLQAHRLHLTLTQRTRPLQSCGSLYTSLAPCLALSGMASAIRSSRSLRAKILLLNPTNDRETHGYSAVDYIDAIAQTLNRSVCASS
jgi:hypothetical protein